MCGKFTAMASWSEVVEYSTALTSERDTAGMTKEERKATQKRKRPTVSDPGGML